MNASSGSGLWPSRIRRSASAIGLLVSGGAGSRRVCRANHERARTRGRHFYSK
jgi:hypothetical protein